MELLPLRLSELAGAAAARLDLGILESEVPALPVTALRDLMPHLSLFYLDRLQSALQQQGVSLEPKWKQLCQELVGKQVGCRGSVATQTHPHDGETTWHERFMGLLFRVTLGDLQSAASRKRLVLPFVSDPGFSALELCAPHVRRLAVSPPLDAFCSLLQPPQAPVLATLARTLASLDFKRLGSDCRPSRERLGAVVRSLTSLREVSFEQCLALRAELLECVLGACMGSELAVKRGGGDRADVEDEVPAAGTAKRLRWDASTSATVADSDATADDETELLYSQLSPEEQEHCSDDDSGPEDLFDVSLTEGPRLCRCRKTSVPVSVATVLECLGIQAVEGEDGCYVPAGGRGGGPSWNSPDRTRPPPGPYSTLCPPLTVTVLRFSGTPLSAECAVYLEDALSRWVCLERLVLIDTELGSRLPHVLHALRRLSRASAARFSHLDLRDDTLALPMLTVAGCVLASFPRLHLLRLATVLPGGGGGSGVPPLGCRLRGCLPPCQLRELSLCSCSSAVDLGRLLELLESARGSLRRVSLRGRTLARRADLGLVLRSLAAPGNRLDSLRLGDMGTRLDLDALADAVRATQLSELALRHCPSSFATDDAPRWDGLALALRQNANLRRLVLARNRLCRRGLRALATLFGEGAACRITHLDISFNCLEPDAVLEFALALAGEGASAPHRLEVLDITGNRLQSKPAVTKQALALLRSCADRVLHEGWDAMHAFADHVSVM